MSAGGADAALPPLERGPDVWTACDVGPYTIDLGADDIAELQAAAAPYVARGESGDAARSQPGGAPGTDVLDDLAKLTPAGFPLPRLGPRLVALRHELLHGKGFALLRGLPVEGASRLQLATVFLGIGAHLGAARRQNAAGHLLGHVCDLGLHSSDPNVRIYQTRERQTFHTDSCDVVGLLCLREARAGGDSLLVSAGAIYEAMRQAYPERLARLLRPMAHDRRGEVPAGMAPFFLLPVFSWFEGQLTVFYQRQYLESAMRFPEAPRLTDADVAALDTFDALANDPAMHIRMRLAPGDIQLVHNHALLHDRTAFEDGPDPAQRRHLLRLWLACPGARPLPPAFAARYGSVTVGDRGGVAVAAARAHVALEPARPVAPGGSSDGTQPTILR